MNNNGFAVQKKNNIYIVSRLEYFVGTQGTSTPQKSAMGECEGFTGEHRRDERTIGASPPRYDTPTQCRCRLLQRRYRVGNRQSHERPLAVHSILRFATRTTRTKNLKGLSLLGRSRTRSLTTTRLLKLKYLTAERAAELIPQSVTALATVKAIKEQNGLVVVGPVDAVEQVKECLAQMDQPVAQVLIEAIVIDYDVSDGSEFGIEAGVLGGPDTVSYSRRGCSFPVSI